MHTIYNKKISLKVVILFIVFSILLFCVPFYYLDAAVGTGTGQPNNQSTGTGQPSNVSTGTGQLDTKLPTLQNPLKVDNVRGVIDLAVDIAMYLGLAFGTLMLIYAGFKFITAQGDPSKITEAKNLFFAVVIGIAVLISARLIVDIIRDTLTSAGVVRQGVLGK